MNRFAGALTLLIGLGWGAASARVSPIADEAVVTPRPVFTLLIGQPLAPGLPPLSAVDTDVAMMHAFFGALSPQHNYVHLPAGDVRDDLSDARTAVGPPTWTAIEASVEALAEDLRAVGGRADVYVYYAGHGQKRRVGAHTHTDLFLHPEPDADAAGHDGVLSTRLLQQAVLDPLEGDETRVHLVVDACQSAYLLEARGMRRTERVFKAPPRVEPAMLERFTGRHARVGALLATSGSQVTYEAIGAGGLFSYAVRTAGVGLGDLDGDGRVTYGELAQVLPRILSRRAGGASPTLLAPGDRADEAFLDYRGRPLARVTFDPRQATRYELNSPFLEPYAAIYPDGTHPIRVYLPADAPFLAAVRVNNEGPRVWSRFTAANQLFAMLQQPLDAPRTARSADAELAPLVLDRPLDTAALVPVADPQWVWVPERYTTLALSGVTEAPVLGRTLDSSLASLAGGVEVAGALGDGPDQLAWRVGYSLRTSSERYDAKTITHREGHLARMGLGYSHVLAELSLFELSAGGFVGGGLLIEERGRTRAEMRVRPTHYLPMGELGGELTARVLFPGSVWALRSDLRVSGQGFLDEHRPYADLVVGATLGFEYEFVLR